MARIGTFSEEVVCPAEQVVKVRNKLDYARNFGATHTINATRGNVVE
jgi:Zn-dependent alcohol dehydrogenase